MKDLPTLLIGCAMGEVMGRVVAHSEASALVAAFFLAATACGITLWNERGAKR